MGVYTASELLGIHMQHSITEPPHIGPLPSHLQYRMRYLVMQNTFQGDARDTYKDQYMDYGVREQVCVSSIIPRDSRTTKTWWQKKW
jgi:hypothetical protein